MTDLMGQEAIYKLADGIVSKAGDAACEIEFFRTARGLTRLANSTIHQNIAVDETAINIRVSKGEKLGVASTNIMTEAGMKECLDNALEIMKAADPLEGFPPPAPAAEYAKTDTYVETTADWGPSERAKVAVDAIARGKDDGLTLAGAVETTLGEIGIVNSNGVHAYQPLSAYACNFVAMDGEGDDPPSGYAALTGRDVKTAEFRETYDRACRKAVLARDPVEVDIGKYDVVLEAGAFCELVEWFNYISLSAKAVQDGKSPFAGHLNEKITGDMVNMVDDAYNSTIQGLPFDFDGVPRQKLTIFDKGVAKGVAYSRFLAKKDKVEPTGHGFGPSGMPSDAIPLNLRFLPGDKTLDEMVKMLDRGIQVTRFHYVNGLLDTRKAVMTGMTRDGAWLIENGEIKHAIKNLRFTDSMLEAWKRIEAIENKCHPSAGWWSAIGSYDIPAVLIRDFTFTGKTGKGS